MVHNLETPLHLVPVEQRIEYVEEQIRYYSEAKQTPTVRKLIMEFRNMLREYMEEANIYDPQLHLELED